MVPAHAENNYGKRLRQNLVKKPPGPVSAHHPVTSELTQSGLWGGSLVAFELWGKVNPVSLNLL